MIKSINELIEKATKELESKQVKTKETAYVAKLREVLEFKQQAEEKREQGLKGAASIQEHIDVLNSQYIQESDKKKLEALATKRKELRVEMMDMQGVADTEFMHYVKAKLEELEPLRQEMSVELSQRWSNQQKFHEELSTARDVVKDVASKFFRPQPMSSNEANSLERMIQAEPSHQRAVTGKQDRTLTTTIDGWGRKAR